MANEKPARYITDAYEEDSLGPFAGACAVGNEAYGGGGATKGALRFTNIDLNNSQSFDFARLVYKYLAVGGGGTWKFKAYGIKETNTGAFGYPFGRTKTSASITVNESAPTAGGHKDLDVKAIIQEIIGQGGWSNGNAMGFIFEDDGSSGSVYAFADIDFSYLIYRISAEPNFFPSPVVIVAPTFPAADDVGMKISFPGQDVLAAAEADLLFTTRKDVLKMQAEAQVSTTAGVEKLIAHGLSYKPACYAFVRKNNLSFELPRLFGGASDPVGGGVQGYISVDATYLRILTFTDADVYYYILLDEQPT